MPTIVFVGGPVDGERKAVERLPREYLYTRFGSLVSPEAVPVPYRDRYRPVSVETLPEDVCVYAHESVSAATCMLMLVAGYRQPRYKAAVV